jgi:polyisoprenoid-binding protein YceI
MRNTLALCAVIALAGCSPAATEAPAKAQAPAAAAITPVATEAPGGAYTLDPAHTSLIFKVDHIGLTNYTARFLDVDGTLQFDPQQPERSSISATVDAGSLETDYRVGDIDFNAMLEGPDWLGVAQHPKITYRSNRVVLTGPQTARIEGELTMKGVTRPLTLEARFNGGYAAGMDPENHRIGFSARGALNRSEFGIKTGIPAAGSKIGVGDRVEVILEAEFIQPAQKAGG